MIINFNDVEMVIEEVKRFWLINKLFGKRYVFRVIYEPYFNITFNDFNNAINCINGFKEKSNAKTIH